MFIHGTRRLKQRKSLFLRFKMFKQSKKGNNPLHIDCILLIIVDITTKMNLLMANIPYHLATTYGRMTKRRKMALIKPVSKRKQRKVVGYIYKRNEGHRKTVVYRGT